MRSITSNFSPSCSGLLKPLSSSDACEDGSRLERLAFPLPAFVPDWIDCSEPSSPASLPSLWFVLPSVDEDCVDFLDGFDCEPELLLPVDSSPSWLSPGSLDSLPDSLDCEPFLPPLLFFSCLPLDDCLPPDFPSFPLLSVCSSDFESLSSDGSLFVSCGSFFSLDPESVFPS